MPAGRFSSVPGALARSSLLVTLAFALLGLGAVAVRAQTTSLGPLSPLSRGEVRAWGVLLALMVGAAWLFVGPRRPRLASDLTVAAVSTFAAGSVMYALRDTPWGLHALTGDMVLRTEAVTRFTESVSSADYAYRGLPSYYPPLVPWVEARFAELLGVSGWQMVKPGQIALALLVPVLAYVLWARVTQHPRAALIVTVTTLFAANVYKVDQWLPLAVLLPWWLDAFRDVRRPGVRPWPAWVHGLIAGAMLTTYTFYFLPLALATVLGLVVDVVRRRPWRPPLVRYAVIAAVGLLVSAWYWLPALLTRVGGPPTDRFQMRWFNPDITMDVPAPLLRQSVQIHLGTGQLTVALLMAAGVLYMLVSARTRGDAEALLLVGTSTMLTLSLGLVAAAAGRPFLGFKAMDLAVHVMLAAGVLGLVSTLHRAARARPPGTSEAMRAAIGGIAVLAMLTGTLFYAKTWAAGEAVTSAYRQPLPDGSWPARKPPGVKLTGSMPGAPRTPSLDEVRSALGGAAEHGSVVLTSRFDLLATTPFHLFLAWSSINSHPNGEFAQRVELVRRLAAEPDPDSFTRLAQDNRFDAIDAFVLERRGGSLVYRFRVDGFPQPPEPVEISFRPEQFDPADWEITELGSLAVVTRR